MLEDYLNTTEVLIVRLLQLLLPKLNYSYLSLDYSCIGV